jgi:hypothetical protein
VWAVVRYEKGEVQRMSFLTWGMCDGREFKSWEAKEWWAVGEKISALGHEQDKYHGTGDRACLRDFKLDQAWEVVAHLCAMIR